MPATVQALHFSRRRLIMLWNWKLALLSAAFGLFGTIAWGQTSNTSVRGEIKSFTTAPKGETDGAMLTDGSYIHWPPHVGERIAAILKVGDRLESEGRWENGPEGDRRFEAERVINTKTNERVEIDGPRRGARPDAKPRRGDTSTKVGRIKEVTTAPKGEVDGALLKDGTTLHWPPHLEGRFRTVAAVGAEVRAVGRDETTPRGDSHFEVQSLTNLDTDQTAANDDEPAPPRGPRANRDERLRDLQQQLDRIQREIVDLRRAD
ncbi:MAG TPA: hypothetical protein VGN12_09470 [Pirellulales bacterium]